jgi:hypothetical protein
MIRMALTGLVVAWVVSLVRLVATWRAPVPVAIRLRRRDSRAAA